MAKWPERTAAGYSIVEAMLHAILMYGPVSNVSCNYHFHTSEQEPSRQRSM